MGCKPEHAVRDSFVSCIRREYRRSKVIHSLGGYTASYTEIICEGHKTAKGVVKGIERRATTTIERIT